MSSSSIGKSSSLRDLSWNETRESRTPKDGSLANGLRRRLFQDMSKLTVSSRKLRSFSHRSLSPSSSPLTSHHVENSVLRLHVQDVVTFENSSPTEGPEFDSPYCRNLLHDDGLVRSKLKLLGRGSFGSVVFGFKEGSKIALKIAKRECKEEGENNSLGFNHKNIVKVLRIYESKLRRVVVMEYAGSRNLKELLIQQHSDIHWNFKLRCAMDIARGLAYCHQKNVLHRDIKPENVIVSSCGLSKLTDFGCSLTFNDVLRLPRAGQNKLVGTVPYLSPELLRGWSPTSKSDIYAMGILLWQLLTRRIPYEGEDTHSIIYKVVSMNLRPPLPESRDLVGKKLFSNIVKQCWSIQEDQRPSATQLCKMLENI